LLPRTAQQENTKLVTLLDRFSSG